MHELDYREDWLNYVLRCPNILDDIDDARFHDLSNLGSERLPPRNERRMQEIFSYTRMELLIMSQFLCGIAYES